MRIIVLEGPDKLGKTTQAKLLADALRCEYIKFPNESYYSGKKIRKILNGELPFEPASFQALQIINRFETFDNLDQNGTYVCDRGTLSGVVYGQTDGLPREWIIDISKNLPAPDITFVFVGTPYEQDADIYGDVEKQRLIAELYKEEAKKISGRVELIHNGRSTEAIHKEILGKLRGIASIGM
jgi:dTMP kinase